VQAPPDLVLIDANEELIAKPIERAGQSSGGANQLAKLSKRHTEPCGMGGSDAP
jgi:hypothetical protein